MYGKQQEGQRSGGCRGRRLGKCPDCPTGLWAPGEVPPSSKLQTTGMHWEATWGEVVCKLEESRKAVT